MEIKDFVVNGTYKRADLIEAFGGSFMRGMNICNKTGTLVLISKHVTNRIYGDSFAFHNDIIYYTGEGQRGDQTLQAAGNKKLYNSVRDNTPVHLFVVYKNREYKYFGLVKFSGDIKWEYEPDVDGVNRKVIRFPLSRVSNNKWMMDPNASTSVVTGGVTIKPTLKVVGAAILSGDKVLCCQRKGGELDGKWEFAGGKIEPGESPIEAIKREIKEELNIDIEVCDKLDESVYDDGNRIIDLSVFTCKQIGGNIKNIVHKNISEVAISEISTLSWAEADKPICESLVDVYEESNPVIVDKVKYDYFESESITRNKREMNRRAEDYEKSQRVKKRSGDRGEAAVLSYERDKLNNADRPDLADKVRNVGSNNTLGYDIDSFEIVDGVAQELHIEVKVAKVVGGYLEFFISAPELEKFKANKNHVIYCLIRNGNNYNLHIVRREDFLLKAGFEEVAYRVRIRITN